MNQPVAAPQRIARLASLAEIHAAVDRLVSPVAARTVEARLAKSRILAADVTVAAACPAAAVALRDGWAVRADLVADAGPYSPVPLAPAPHWVEAGDPLPADTDAVLPPDALAPSAAFPEAIGPAAPGEGVLPAEADAAPGRVLRRAGERVRHTDVAVFRATGIEHVEVRDPLVSLLIANAGITEHTDVLLPWLAHAVAEAGGAAHFRDPARQDLERALLEDSSDAVIVIGGTGAGRNDRAVRTLTTVGTVHIHGMGIIPGETAALGAVGSRPVLLLPGRLDAALAGWLLVGVRLLGRLTGAREPGGFATGILARKIVSNVGMAEVVLVRRTERGLEPVSGGYLPLQAIAAADGCVFVPAESEGFPSGASVELRPLP
jgi:molybdopterin molybdotransferase